MKALVVEMLVWEPVRAMVVLELTEGMLGVLMPTPVLQSQALTMTLVLQFEMVKSESGTRLTPGLEPGLKAVEQARGSEIL